MKQKAFTMIELLGIMAILGIILLMTAPTILNSLKKQEADKYNTFLNQINVASETYVVENPDYFDWTKTDNKIDLADLVNNDYISGNTVNPKTDKKLFDEKATIYVIKDSDSVLSFNYVTE